MTDHAIGHFAPPSPAHKYPVTDNYFGTPVDDDFRWLEDAAAEPAGTWLDEQASYARRVLDGLPSRESLAEALFTAVRSTPSFASVHAADERIFYLTRVAGKEHHVLVMNRAFDHGLETILDPNEQLEDLVIDWFRPSPDGRRLAIGLSLQGTEASSLHIYDVDSHMMLSEDIPRVHFGFVNWLDHDQLVYLRYPKLSDNTPAENYYMGGAVFLHSIDEDAETDREIFGPNVTTTIDWQPIDRPRVIPMPDKSSFLGEISHGTSPFKSYFLCTENLLAQPQVAQWLPLASPEELVTDVAADEQTIYLLSFADAPQGQILAIPSRNGTTGRRVLVRGDDTEAIERIYCVDSTLLTSGLYNGVGHLRHVDLATMESRSVSLPWEGTIIGACVDHSSKRLVFVLTSWLRPPQLVVYEPASRKFTTSSKNAGPVAGDDAYSVELVTTSSNDGTAIPITILRQRGVSKNAAQPTILFGYGSFGISASPRFMPEILPWLDHGGIFAIAHVRGGGEYGRAWHEAGLGRNKPTTISDYEACAEYLIREGYTSSPWLAAYGASAGGIPASVAVARRPDLWGALVLVVAVLNPLRGEHSPAGPMYVEEFGSTASPDGFQTLLTIDGYHQLVDGRPYPPTLAIAGLRDPRVAIWNATKFVARLQTASSSHAPVLLRCDMEAGHGFNTTTQIVSEYADVYAFLLATLGGKWSIDADQSVLPTRP